MCIALDMPLGPDLELDNFFHLLFVCLVKRKLSSVSVKDIDTKSVQSPKPHSIKKLSISPVGGFSWRIKSSEMPDASSHKDERDDGYEDKWTRRYEVSCGTLGHFAFCCFEEMKTLGCFVFTGHLVLFRKSENRKLRRTKTVGTLLLFTDPILRLPSCWRADLIMIT